MATPGTQELQLAPRYHSESTQIASRLLPWTPCCQGYSAKVTLPRLHSQGYAAKFTQPRLPCLGYTAKVTQPRLRCQGYAAKVTLPRLHSKDYTAKVTLPKLRSQGYIAQVTQPRLHCPGYAAKVTLPRLHSQGTSRLLPDCFLISSRSLPGYLIPDNNQIDSRLHPDYFQITLPACTEGLQLKPQRVHQMVPYSHSVWVLSLGS